MACSFGTFLGIGNELQTSGLKYTMPSKSAFLTGVAVVLVPVFLALFWKAKTSAALRVRRSP